MQEWSAGKSQKDGEKVIQRASEEWPEGWKKQTREVGDLKTSGGRSFMKEEIELSK